MELDPKTVQRAVTIALEEDVGTGDINAELIPNDTIAHAKVITRSDGVFCGRPWIDEIARHVAEPFKIDWHVDDGDRILRNQMLFEVSGLARSLLTTERTILNFAQLLSGTATTTRRLIDLVSHTKVKLLDTRKTLPGLRTAQKYAVVKGGGHNHRIGLFDAYLIKENHIATAGSIQTAVERAQNSRHDVSIEVEVENTIQLEEAISSGAHRVLLDNFSVQAIREAIRQTRDRVKLESSGGVTEANLVAVAETGVDYISLGMLTKNIVALDMSMRFESENRHR